MTAYAFVQWACEEIKRRTEDIDAVYKGESTLENIAKLAELRRRSVGLTLDESEILLKYIEWLKWKALCERCGMNPKTMELVKDDN